MILKEKESKEMLLIQQSKMAAMGEMIGAIAHQWKQPLNAISLLVEDIQDAHSYGELDKTYLEKQVKEIRGLVHHMSGTIDDFRNFLKPSKEKMPFLACESCSEVLHIVGKQMESRNIRVTIREHEHFQVLGYPNEFKQVVLNIMNNARDALVEKGIAQGEITVTFEQDSVSGTICIRDNGGGVPDALLPDKLFDAYVTTKGEEGTGIGLQIAKMIIENSMGGELTVRNREEGAEFCIRLPLFRQEENT